MTEAIEQLCPYCNVTLNKVPIRKIKCSQCNNNIYVRTRFSDRKKVLVTKNESIEIDQLWSEYHERNRRIVSLQPFGITEQQFMQTKEQLSKRKGNIVTDIDVSLELLNQLSLIEKESGTLRMIFSEIALIMNEIDQDFIPYLIKAAEMDLLRYNQSRIIKKVRITAAGKASNSCTACLAQDGRELLIEDAMLLKPIPCIECTTIFRGTKKGFCRCCYTPIISK